MSAFFEANKDDYYKKLMNARLKNDSPISTRSSTMYLAVVGDTHNFSFTWFT
jgi:hypothetical protein